jgi:hypothetical protein
MSWIAEKNMYGELCFKLQEIKVILPHIFGLFQREL